MLHGLPAAGAARRVDLRDGEGVAFLAPPVRLFSGFRGGILGLLGGGRFFFLGFLRRVFFGGLPLLFQVGTMGRRVFFLAALLIFFPGFAVTRIVSPRQLRGRGVVA